ncbi:MAG: hypothetical protein ACXW11_03545 [Methylotenera sp.]
MKFSEYIVIESAGGSMDPLGYLRPSSAIADGLFRQFTVLSNHPAYHGFLSFVFLYLEGKGKRPGMKGFSEEFRDIEVLWGILNDRANVSILNVTKFADIAKKADATLTDAKNDRRMYAKLNYGTLGHYSSPSIFWGILNAKGTHLTDLGRKLGVAWSRRGDLNFGTLLDAWLAKESVASINNFSNAVKLFHLDATPSQEEKAAWKEIIQFYCARTSVVSPLWSNPISKEIQNLASQESTYHSYYPTILNHFEKFPDLCIRIELGQQFELLAALAQFVFEWEYVNRLDEVKEVELSAPSVQEAVAEILVNESVNYLKVKGHMDAGKLFQQISQNKTYKEVAATLLTHHSEHQRAKGAAPFLQGQEVMVYGRFDPKKFAMFLETLHEEPSVLIEQKITWRYRRDWHFERATKWLDYAGDMQ